MQTVAQILKNEQQNINNISCVNIISKFVRVYKKGTRFVAFCPIHGDKNTPSMIIYPDTNSWCCFSSNCHNPRTPGRKNGGTGIDFIMQYRNYSYPQALQWIRDNYNVVNNATIPIVDENKKSSTPYTIDYSDIAYYHSLLLENGKREYFYNRGFLDSTINREMFGYDGRSYIIPIWEGEPRKSPVLSIKLRQIDRLVKYIRLGSYTSQIYKLWECRNKHTVLGFAGELDCALATQYGLPSFSLIDGVNGWQKLPSDWPEKLFPNTKKLLVVFDRKEGISAGAMASMWEKVKGRFSSQLIHYPPNFLGDDFNDFILERGIEEFYNLINWNPWTGEQNESREKETI